MRFAPAARQPAIVSGPTPPSTSSPIPGRSRARSSPSRSSDASMKLWPPQPGSTDMHSSRSAVRAASRSAATGVAGFSVTPACMPSSWICPIVWCRCGQVSTCTVHESAPAFANSASCRSGCSIMRCTSIVPPRACTRSANDETTRGPNVITGTKWPSITSTWKARAPASSSSTTWLRNAPKSADRIDGTTCVSAGQLTHRV